LGGSLGGIAVVLEAANYHDTDGVVSISTPALWDHSKSKFVRRATWLFVSPVGRSIARKIMGTRIHLDWGKHPEPPAEVVGKIAPTPILIVHGEDDHFFSADDARTLHERAGEPKRLWLLPEFGHAEDGFTPEFTALLTDEIEAMLGTREHAEP
jgi:pimeloyl-ACP methyl ester carboxylesterase